MLETPVREGVERELRAYEEDASPSHLSEVLNLLEKSTPPISAKERVSWVNELVRQYREVGRAFQTYIIPSQEINDYISTLPGLDLEEIKQGLQTFEEQFKQEDYPGASEILANMLDNIDGISELDGDAPTPVKNIFSAYIEPMKQIIDAYSRLAKEFQDVIKEAEEVREQKSDLEEQVNEIGNF